MSVSCLINRFVGEYFNVLVWLGGLLILLAAWCVGWLVGGFVLVGCELGLLFGRSGDRLFDRSLG